MRTYQLHLLLPRPCRLQVGRLGIFHLPAGFYMYTGSARRGLTARVSRHFSRAKTLRWHIDYLLDGHARIVDVRYFAREECALNRATPGRVLIPRFGASDCRAGCGSHLKYLGIVETIGGLPATSE